MGSHESMQTEPTSHAKLQCPPVQPFMHRDPALHSNTQCPPAHDAEQVAPGSQTKMHQP